MPHKVYRRLHHYFSNITRGHLVNFYSKFSMYNIRFIWSDFTTQKKELMQNNQYFRQNKRIFLHHHITNLNGAFF